MHENNPFENIKDYWGSYYSTLTEGALKGLLNDMGYYFTDEGKHAGKWVHEKTGKALSDDHAMEIASERSKRKKKTKEVDASGPNPTDKDARKQGEESTRSEEVEYDGEDLEEMNGRFSTKTPRVNRYSSRASLERGDRARGIEGGLPGPDDSAYGRARMRSSDTEGKMKKLKALGKGSDTMFKREFSGFSGKQEGLFHKDTDRLLREHIRSEYEARGIYPTSREVQETYNQIMDIFEATRASERDATLSGARGKQKIGGKMRRSVADDRRIGALRGERQGLLKPGEIKDPTNQSSDEFNKFVSAHTQRHATHDAARGVGKVSPSSPARKQSKAEVDTRFLMGQGFSAEHLRRIMSNTGR